MCQQRVENVFSKATPKEKLLKSKTREEQVYFGATLELSEKKEQSSTWMPWKIYITVSGKITCFIFSLTIAGIMFWFSHVSEELSENEIEAFSHGICKLGQHLSELFGDAH